MARQKRKDRRKRKRGPFGALPWSVLAGNTDDFIHRVGPHLVARVAARRAELNLAPCAYVPL